MNKAAKRVALSLLAASASLPMLAEEVYRNDFNTYDDFDACTILDKNNDGVCWDWREYEGKRFAYCLGTESTVTANDWLITPPVALEAGHSYRFVVETQALGEDVERFECRWGTGYHVENLIYPSVSATEMGEEFQDAVTVSGVRSDVTRSGDYRFAYHMISDPYSTGVAVLSMRVEHLGLTGDLPQEETLIYSEPFESSASFLTFKTYDLNGDGAVWIHNGTKKCAQYTYSSANAANDWLISPPLPLEVGRNYKLRFKASTQSMPEKIEVTIGSTDKPSDQTTVLVETTQIAKRSEVELGNDLFKVSASGSYHIGFHAVSDKDCDKLYVDDIKVYDIGANGESGDPFEPGTQGRTLPYTADMTDPVAFADYSVIDANYDGRTWKYDPIFNTTLYGYSPERDADDWLITPALAFKAGKNYKLTVTAASRGLEFPEKFEAKLGKGTDIDSYDVTLIEPETLVMNVGDPALKFQSGMFSVEEDADLSVGIHALSAANMSDLLVYAVDVVEVNADAPLAVTNLNAVADPTGQLKATLSFVAPAKNYAGQDLTEPLTRIEVTRNGSVVKTLFDVPAGSSQTVVDEDPAIKEGMNQYSVTAYVGESAGDVAQVNLFIGADVPLKVSGIKGTDIDGAVRLEWNEVAKVGKNGGVVYPAHVTYNIYEAIPEYTFGIITSINLRFIRNVSATETVIEVPELGQGAHEAIHFAVRPVNQAGEGDAAYANLMKGAPYELPFEESVGSGEPDTYLSVDTDCVDENSSLYLSNNASDGDGGAFAFVSYEGDKYLAMFTGKIAVKGAAEPMLEFDAMNSIGNNLLKVQVITPDNQHHDLLAVRPGAEYENYEASLYDYRDCLWIRLIFAVEYPMYVNADDGNELDLDAIRVSDIGSGVRGIADDTASSPAFPCDVYSVDGRLIRKNATSLDGLKGIVIVNGHKFVVR